MEHTSFGCSGLTRLLDISSIFLFAIINIFIVFPRFHISFGGLAWRSRWGCRHILGLSR